MTATVTRFFQPQKPDNEKTWREVLNENMSHTEFLLSKNLITENPPAGESEANLLSPGRAFFRAVLLVLLTVLAGHWLTSLLFRQVYFGRWEPLIESSLVIVMLFPVSYFFFFRPLVAQAEACRRAEREVREQARMLALAHDGILVRDLQGCVRFWNQGAQRLLGWTSAEIMGRQVSEFGYCDPQKFKMVNEAVLQQGEWQGELQSKTKNGSEIVVSARMTLIRDEQGYPKSVLTILWDISEQKKLEAKFLRAQRLESIGVLAGGIAHDLNNILAPILMSAQLLRMNEQDEQTDEMLNTIETSARRGADIVKQVLTFARGAEGKRSLVQLKHLIKEFAKLAQETFPKNINVRVDFPADLWLTLADATQMHQVVMNLAVNARDAMPDGGVLTISAENLLRAPFNSRNSHNNGAVKCVLLKVSDTGTGVAPEIREKIFDPFFTTKDLGKGTGLGLSTALTIVRSHGGWIDLKSEVGKGSTFEIYLPATKDDAIEVAEGKHATELNGHGEVVLIVDDEASFCEMAKCVLQLKGYRVLTALNGAKARELFSKHASSISVVVTDQMMPDVDGTVLLREFKKIKPGIRVIVATGSTSEEQREEILRAGAAAILAKPFTTEELLSPIHDLLPVEPERAAESVVAVR